MNIEDLKNVSINLDSQTAKEIAYKYIMYKYVDDFLAAFVVLSIMGIIIFAIYKFFTNLDT